MIHASHVQKRQNLAVIQSSKTAPLFCDINYGDLASMCFRDGSILYADDTVLLFVAKSLEELTDHVDNRLRSILEWYNHNKLSLNPSKSGFMVATNKRLIDRPQLLIC